MPRRSIRPTTSPRVAPLVRRRVPDDRRSARYRRRRRPARPRAARSGAADGPRSNRRRSMRAATRRARPSRRRSWRPAGMKPSVPPDRHDTVLAATMPALFDEPEAVPRALPELDHAARSSGSCRRTPGRAGCASPAACRANGMAKTKRPASISSCAACRRRRGREHVSFADWTFTGIVPDLDELAAYLADRLGWAAVDDRRARTAHAISRAGQAGRGAAAASTFHENLPFLCGGNRDRAAFMSRRGEDCLIATAIGVSPALRQVASPLRHPKPLRATARPHILPEGRHHRDRPARAARPHRRHGPGHPSGHDREVDGAIGRPNSSGRERRRLHERMDARARPRSTSEVPRPKARAATFGARSWC